MSYKNLIELTDYLEQFEREGDAENKLFTIEGFAFWLANKLAKKPREARNTANDDSFHQQSIDVQISILIGRMAKYARNYSKQILAKTKLSGLDDYSFMATLMFRESMTKSELTHHNITENTSGADIIRRLVQHGYIMEYDDVNDKRSKRVKVTSLGRKVMFMVFNEMEITADIVTGNLDESEKLFLLDCLKKLDGFHKVVYDNDRKANLESIQKKYITN